MFVICLYLDFVSFSTPHGHKYGLDGMCLLYVYILICFFQYCTWTLIWLGWNVFVICQYLDLFLSVLHMDIDMAWMECVCYMSIS